MNGDGRKDIKTLFNQPRRRNRHRVLRLSSLIIATSSWLSLAPTDAAFADCGAVQSKDNEYVVNIPLGGGPSAEWWVPNQTSRNVKTASWWSLRVNWCYSQAYHELYIYYNGQWVGDGITRCMVTTRDHWAHNHDQNLFCAPTTWYVGHSYWTKFRARPYGVSNHRSNAGMWDQDYDWAWYCRRFANGRWYEGCYG
jgi:hypothetical protein